MSRGAMKLPCTNPCRSKLANHRLSFGSLFLPRNALTCSGFAKMTFRLPSKILNTGFQYEPVLSMTTSVHPLSSSHVRSLSNSFTLVPKSPNLPDRLLLRQSNQNANRQKLLSHIDSRTFLDFDFQHCSSFPRETDALVFNLSLGLESTNRRFVLTSARPLS